LTLTKGGAPRPDLVRARRSTSTVRDGSGSGTRRYRRLLLIAAVPGTMSWPQAIPGWLLSATQPALRLTRSWSSSQGHNSVELISDTLQFQRGFYGRGSLRLKMRVPP